MNANLWTQLLIAIVPALITGVGSLIIAIKKCKNEINTLETNNKHEIEKLMKKHKIDIEALNEKHRLDIETKEKEHQLKIEEIKVQNEQEILKREKELSNSAMYSMMGDATKDLFAGIFNSPEFKEEMSKKIKEGFNKKKLLWRYKMGFNEKENSLEYWDNIHSKYERNEIKLDDWLDKFETIIDSCSTPILDLGCGSGNDTLYLINKNKQVISCDQSSNAINNIKKNFPEVYDTKCFNMLDGMPFDNNSFELIIADLCLHYFKEKDTFELLNEIRRILTVGGRLIFQVNSVNDVNHGAGQGNEIEHHLYETSDKRLKRFFDEKDIKFFFKDFDIEYLNEEIMTRYKLEKRLYRVCVRKK